MKTETVEERGKKVYTEPVILLSYTKEDLETSLLPSGENGVHGGGGCGCGCGCS
jgi:hypothetical protein